MNEFIEAIKDKDYLEAIYLADQEATAAERLKFKPRAAGITKGCPRYADRLKGFIYFMRHGIRNRLLSEQEYQTLRSIRESLLSKYALATESEESLPAL
jgi:hypothetical protein